MNDTKCKKRKRENSLLVRQNKRYAYKQGDFKQLFPFQVMKVNEMIYHEAKCLETKIKDATYYLINCLGILNLDVGNGKTIVACGRLMHWLDHKLGKSNDCLIRYPLCNGGYIESDCSTRDNYVENNKTFLSFDIRELCLMSRVFSNDERECDNCVSFSKLSLSRREVFKSNLCIILVASPIFLQWKTEAFNMFKSQGLEEHFCIANRISDVREIIGKGAPKVLLMTFSFFRSYFVFPDYTDRGDVSEHSLSNIIFDLIIVDESHILKKQEIIRYSEKCNFLWCMTACKEITQRNSNLKLCVDNGEGFFEGFEILGYHNLSDDYVIRGIPVIGGDELSTQLTKPIHEFVEWNHGSFESFLKKNDIEIPNLDLLDIGYIREKMIKLVIEKSIIKYRKRYDDLGVDDKNPYLIELSKEIPLERRVKFETYCLTNKYFFPKISSELRNEFFTLYAREAILPNFLIKIEEECGICMSSDTNKKLLTNCCQNAVCGNCLRKLAGLNAKCPYCRADNFTEDSKIMVKKLFLGNNYTDEPKSFFHVFSSVVDKLLNDGGNIKILAVCTDPGKLSDKFMFNVGFLIIDTKISIASELRKFQSDPNIKIAILNANFCDYGFNLHFVDVLIIMNEFRGESRNQIIGRVQRYPRNTTLKIIELVKI